MFTFHDEFNKQEDNHSHIRVYYNNVYSNDYVNNYIYDKNRKNAEKKTMPVSEHVK